MKKKIKWICIVGVMIVTSILKVYAEEPNNLRQTDYLDKYELIYQNMVDKVKYTMKTGDLNLDFLFYMLSYEQFGVEFSKAELHYGSNKTVKKVVNEIVKKNEEHIKSIEKLLKVIENSPVVDEIKEASYLEQFNQIYNEMLLILKLNKENPIESVDADYLEKMIIYLDYQRKFVNLILLSSDQEEVVTLVKKIISNNDHSLEKLNQISSHEN